MSPLVPLWRRDLPDSTDRMKWAPLSFFLDDSPLASRSPSVETWRTSLRTLPTSLRTLRRSPEPTLSRLLWCSASSPDTSPRPQPRALTNPSRRLEPSLRRRSSSVSSIHRYDDCRQDALALQVMKIIQILWDTHGYYLPLHIYNVTPARTSTKDLAMGGIIEAVCFFSAPLVDVDCQ